MIKKIIWLCAFMLVCGVCGAWEVDVESGLVSPGYNDIQVPGKTGTRFSLPEALSVENKVFYRLRITHQIANDRFISVLYAPLSLSADGSLGVPVSFNGTIFASGSQVNATYRFDSYRISYWKKYTVSPAFNWKLGFTAKIRDAAIRLTSNAITSEKKNTGFVPLLNFGAQYAFNSKLSAVFDGDALAGGPGRAEDVLLAAQYQTSPHSRLKLGYRIVEGGADVDEVYNFTLLNYWIVGFTYTF